ncbi:MAG TPA: aminotransferase class IV [Stenotrophomonas sp.]
MTVLLCNGEPADATALAALAQINYGHFTALAVRDGKAQGLDLHLRRLCGATRAMFDVELDESRVRYDLRRALAAHGAAEAWVRITVFSRAFDFRAPLRQVPVDLLTSATPWAPPPMAAARVQPVVFRRHRPELKHVATFPLFDLRRQALAGGWDDAVFIEPDGRLTEGTTWNLGLWDGEGVTWPSGPALRGTAEQLLRHGLAQARIAQRDEVVALDELGRYPGAFACNARGLWPLAAIGKVGFGQIPLDLLVGILASQPWQPV